MAQTNPSSIDDHIQTPITSVGPGTLTAKPDAQPSLLDGVTEYEWVDLFNPLSVSFIAQVASSRPINSPVQVRQTPGLESGIRTESDLATQYGLTGFKNKEHPSHIHIPHTIEIASGRVRRLPGNEAQVVLRQIVGYLLQVEGKGLKLADPYERGLAEKRIIRGRGNISDLMTESPVSISDQLNNAVTASNIKREEPPHVSVIEPAFPQITGTTGTEGLKVPEQFGNGDSDSPKA